MRIVGGRFRGRPLKAPRADAKGGQDLRPTADRVRESLFNVLLHGIEGADLEGAAVIDVFAGTGALGLEALSRGAVHAVFIDNDKTALACVRRNAGALGVGRQVTLLGLDARHPPPPPLAARAPCPLAFLDPPYVSGLAGPALSGLAARGWLAKGAVCVAEVGAKEALEAPKGFRVLDERTYGKARVVFLRYD